MGGSSASTPVVVNQPAMLIKPSRHHHPDLTLMSLIGLYF